MAQLIKLQDYISRYETDVYRYPGQFTRLKKENYEAIYRQWVNQPKPEGEEFNHEEEQPRWRNWFKRHHEPEDELTSTLPKTEEELKIEFLDKTYQFQLKWASSTLQEVSFLDRMYEIDERLKYFLTRFPDTYLLMYYPIFRLKHALLEGEIILITPTEVLCINWLDDGSNSVYEPVDQRKWLKKVDETEKMVVNPNIALKRMESTVRTLLDYHNVNFDIKKLVLTSQGVINYNHLPFQTEYVDRENYQTWFQSMRESKIPLKHKQLKVAETLLSYTQTTSIKRPEWEDVESDEQF
ncbi:hypothetical protein J2R98_001105 [Alkalibacillus filiformis]|uniref:NERD domain-containing protein n=1 Tax=Alkalibacillus filiformis TaxID=200990 RepID=A0ABU0DS80_9BACI|nr:NERD domain-containing protein [Alkalibacillus filiformis]MDQ0351302.1 hypothetical protein [Alkalibacillus filiformis]